MKNRGKLKRIAILKPDHLGDLVLSIPAIRQIQRNAPESVLFCHPACVELARALFPGLECRPVSFPLLDKTSATPAPFSGFPDEFELWISLRSTVEINRWIPGNALTFSSPSDMEWHETRLQEGVVTKACGPYDRSELFHADGGIFSERPFPRNPRRVGLCVSAGFATNAWNPKQWLELQRLLAKDGVTTTWIGGPAEARLIAWLERMTPGSESRSIVGGKDFGEFWRQVGALDLVVATDSGTAHLCSRVAPVLSLFGASPFRRYAPFGRNHRVLTYDLRCSPCPQFMRDSVNTCLTRECLLGIPARSVAEALALPHRGPQGMRAISGGLQLWDGISHSGNLPTAEISQ